MYTWNNINIKIRCSDNKYISDILEYTSIFRTMPSEENADKEKADITVTICNEGENMLPPFDKNTEILNKYNIFLEKETELKICSNEKGYWYIYEGIAGIWVDLLNCEIKISLSCNLFSFRYYNILVFLLYPLGTLLQKFGYNRVHASSVDIGGRALLFTGMSGSGKSTAAFAVAAGGGNIIADDMTFIKNAGDCYNVFTITRLVKLGEEAIGRFFPELLKQRCLKGAEQDIYFDVNDINDRAYSESGKNKLPPNEGKNGNCPDPPELNAAIILEKTGSKDSDYSKIHPLKTIPHLFPSSIQVNRGESTLNKFNFLTDLLDNIRCYKVDFGTSMPGFYGKVKTLLYEI